MPLVQIHSETEVISFLTFPDFPVFDPVHYASIHSNPPGVATAYPMMIEGSYGKGRFIWSAVPVEAIATEEYSELFLHCLDRLVADSAFSFVTTAPAEVEITLFEDADAYYVNATHLEERGVMPTVQPFEIGVKCADAQRVELLPDRTPVPFEKRGDYLYFKTRPMHVFDMYRILK